jgi:threonine synthase
LAVTPAEHLARSDIVTADRSLWRYRRWIAHQEPPRIALGEGWTPFVRREFEGHEIGWKCDFLNPSGSFKDRGVAVMVNFLVAQHVTSVTEDSSGNGGASLATYAAAASLDCSIYVPASTSAGKVAQIAATGARIVKIPGDRQAVTDAALNDVSGAYYASHNWHPMFAEGVKTIGYEIWEQLSFRAPDVIVVPVGGGSNLLGCFRAFKELAANGETPRIPRLVGVQTVACDPLARAMQEGAENYVQVEPRPTIAEGIAISRPIRSREILAAVRDTGGTIISVSETEVRDAYHRLARMGFFVEPTSATAAAGLRRLLQVRAAESSNSIVVILTGSGLKTGELPSEGHIVNVGR